MHIISATYSQKDSMKIVGAESVHLCLHSVALLVAEHIREIRSRIPELKDATAVVLCEANFPAVGLRRKLRKKNNVVLLEDPGYIRWSDWRAAVRRNKSQISFHRNMISTQGLASDLEKEIMELLNKPPEPRRFGIIAAVILNWLASGLYYYNPERDQ